MKQYYILFIKLTVILIVGIGVYFGVFNKSNKVLIIHSYNTDYNWVQQQDIGSKKIFELYPDIRTRYHYMNLKNNISDDSKTKAQTVAMELIKNWNPNIIMISDDIAQQLIGSHFVNDPKISIIFRAVNGGVDAYGYTNAKNVTGIFERKPLFAIKEVILMLAKYKNITNPNIVFVCDTSQSVTAELPQFEQFDWLPLIWYPPLRAENFIGWKKQIEKANQFADFILISDYREFKSPNGNREAVIPMDIMSWTEEHSKVPSIGMSLINVFDGGMLSVFNSGYEQGELSAKMAVKILNGTSAGQIPIVFSTKRFLTSIRKSAIGQRDLQVSDLIIELSETSDGVLE